MASTTPSQHIEAAKRRLVHLSGLAGTTADAERRILAAARARLDAVSADLELLRPRVHIDPAAADQYQERTLEKGQLAHVIASAQQALA